MVSEKVHPKSNSHTPKHLAYATSYPTSLSVIQWLDGWMPPFRGGWTSLVRNDNHPTTTSSHYPSNSVAWFIMIYPPTIHAPPLTMLIPSDGFKQIAQIYYRVSSRNIHSQIFITKAPQLSWRRGCQHKLLVWIDEDLPPPVESMVWSSNTSASGNDSLFLDTEYWLVCIRDWWWQKARVSQYHDAVIKGVICAHWTFGSSVDDSDDLTMQQLWKPIRLWEDHWKVAVGNMTNVYITFCSSWQKVPINNL